MFHYVSSLNSKKILFLKEKRCKITKIWIFWSNCIRCSNNYSRYVFYRILIGEQQRWLNTWRVSRRDYSGLIVFIKERLYSRTNGSDETAYNSLGFDGLPKPCVDSLRIFVFFFSDVLQRFFIYCQWTFNRLWMR